VVGFEFIGLWGCVGAPSSPLIFCFPVGLFLLFLDLVSCGLLLLTLTVWSEWTYGICAVLICSGSSFSRLDP
jgi:hypothetical protein